MAYIPSLTIPQLGLAAGYILWGFRAAAMRHTECRVLREGYQRALGPDGDSALECMHELVRSIGLHGGRKILIGEPGCCGVTADELSVVALIASAQEQDGERRDAHLRWLMGRHGEDRARLAADTIGALFLTAGMGINPPDLELEDHSEGRDFKTHHEAGHA